jgi:hypothetical protein
MQRLMWAGLAVAALVAVVMATGSIGYAPLRWTLVALVAVLVGASWLGGSLGPVADGPVARAVRGGGYVLVAAMVLGIVLDMRTATANPGEQAAVGVSVYTVLLSGYLLGFVAVTRRRSAATTRVLATGAGAGIAAVAVWSAVALGLPPMPATTGPAVVLIGVGALAAAYANAGRHGDAGRGLLAALCAATVGALLVVVVVAALARYGPDSLIPNVTPAALTPIAESRIEIEDPYVGVLFVGSLLAAVLGVAAVRTGRPWPATT